MELTLVVIAIDAGKISDKWFDALATLHGRNPDLRPPQN